MKRHGLHRISVAVVMFLGMLLCSHAMAYVNFCNIGSQAYSQLSLTIPVAPSSPGNILVGMDFSSNQSWLSPKTIFSGNATSSTITFDISQNTGMNSRLARFTGTINGTLVTIDFVQAGTAAITPVYKTVQVTGDAQTAKGVVNFEAAPFESGYTADPSGWVVGKNITITTHADDPRYCEFAVDMPENNSGSQRTVSVSAYRDGNKAQLLGTVTFVQAVKTPAVSFSDSMSIDATGGTLTFNMALASTGQWGFNTSTFTYSGDWFSKSYGPSINNSNASISFYISANASPSPRVGQFTGTINGNLVTLTINQAGAAVAPPPTTDQTPVSDFGPGNASEFYVSSMEKAFVAGVYGLSWNNFTVRSDGYYAYSNDNIIDREKRSGVYAHDHSWCVAYSIIDAAVWGGWGYLGGYGFDEDLFGDAMIVSGTPSDYYSSLLFVYNVLSPAADAAQINVLCDASFPYTLQSHFANAQEMLVTQIIFSNYTWYGTTYPEISHGVVCCGYSLDTTKAITDPTCLKGLFIIDPDNDRENAGGGTSAPNTITYCPVSWDAAQGRYAVSNVFGATGYLDDGAYGYTYFFKCKDSYQLRKSSENVSPAVQHNFGNLSQKIEEIKASNYVADTKAKTYNAAVIDEYGEPVGILTVSVGKMNKSSQSNVKASFIGLDGKKKNAKAVKVTIPSSGALSVSLEMNGYGALEIVLDNDSIAGTMGAFSVLSAELGNAANATKAYFCLEDLDWNESTMLLDEYLPLSEAFAINGTRWVFEKAAVIKYKNGDFDEEAYEKGLNNGKTNNSGLKLTYNQRSGIFKGGFTIYSEDNGGKVPKLKKTRVTVTGIMLDGYGYGQAIIRNGGKFPVTINPL